MRILVHTDEYLPSTGPCANRMKTFVKVFLENGNSVSVVTSAANRDAIEDQLIHDGVYYAPVIRIGSKSTMLRLLNNLSFAISSFLISFCAGKADVVISTSPPPLISISGWLIAKVKRAKLIYDVRDIWPDIAVEMNSFSDKSVYAKVFNRIANFMYRRADLITTVTTGKVEKLRQKVNLPGQRGKIILIGNGFDLSILDAPIHNEIVEKYNMENQFTCVYIGNIGLAQGLDVLLDLASQTKCQNVQFLIFGDGADRDRLMIRARNEVLKNVHFCGRISQDVVPSVLKAAKLSFIPLKSSKMRDSVPTKLYEALGLGCPVLLLAEGDACSVLDETKLGKWVSPENVQEMAAVFDSIVQNYGKILENQKNAVQIIRDRHSRQKEAGVLYKHLSLLVNNHRD